MVSDIRSMIRTRAGTSSTCVRGARLGIQSGDPAPLLFVPAGAGAFALAGEFPLLPPECFDPM